MPFKFDQANKKETVMYTLRNLPPNTTIFFRAYDCGTTHFSAITELKFGKKLPHIFCILTLF